MYFLRRKIHAIAADVGFSDTTYAAPFGNKWRVRYFSPESEVPFCGHATIALGAALTMKYGPQEFTLQLNNAVSRFQGEWRATSSPLPCNPRQQKARLQNLN